MKARYKAIVDRYADEIRSGALAAGTRLPTHRQLSAQEHVSLATATRVYAELEEMGLVSGEVGRGTFVKEISLPAGHGIDQHVIATDMLDLNFNYPSLPEQGELLRESLRQLAMAGDIDSYLRYQPHAGKMSEREIMASYLTNGPFRPSADHLLIVNGAQHGLAVTVMGLLNAGDVVVVDTLTYPGFKALAALYHLELIALPYGADGPDLEALRTICATRHVRALYAIPTLHNPLGWVLSHDQRQTLADIARQHDLLIIEDGSYVFLVDDPAPPLAVYAPERTVYVMGFSKNVATGLRVGAVVCPAQYQPALERAIRATAWNTPSLMSALVCGWIQEGTVARLETLKRQDARQRQAVAREVLGAMPCIAHPASYFLWLPLSDETRADRVVKGLMAHDVSVSTAEPFCTTSSVPQAIRVALGSVSIETLREALSRVKAAIELERFR
ncbi:PLP-dependent aminotransferase family protein [Zymobacter sp. IVIA_12111.31 C1]|uniref:aminotransferase-like domain-containing protein n=1 Tax=Zymobacter sp. IVIA_12111.31 C1 TaxID=3394854 RepID=UPI0039C3DC34